MDFIRENWALLLFVTILAVILIAIYRQQRSYLPPTLPKGFSLLFGVLLALVLSWYLEYQISAALTRANPYEHEAAIFFGWIIGGALGILFFAFGVRRPIPIGFKGVPRIFGARPWFHFLHPEGWTWTIPLITGIKWVDVRGRPLVEYEDPADEEIEVDANVGVMPAPLSTPQTQTLNDLEKLFFAKVTVKIAVRIQIVDPFRYLSYTDAEGFLYNQIEEEVRLWVVDKQIFELPKLKPDLSSHLQEKLDERGLDMGIDFIRIAVTDVILPKDVVDEATRIPIQLMERSKEKYQAETIDQIVQYLKPRFPNLEDRELKNMALTIAGLATSQAYSFEGNAPVPVVPVARSPQHNGGH